MRVKALRYYYHDRIEHHPGEEFDMDDRNLSEVNILCAIGTLEKVAMVAQPQAAAAKPVTKVMEQEPEQASEQAPEQPVAKVMTTEEEGSLTQPKRYYRRRDMRSEK
jgi:hypothetical protein